MSQMKGIRCCGECGYYNWKRHRCTRAEEEGGAQDHFYADCPLPEVAPIVYCYECKHYFDEKGSCNLHDERGADGEIEHRMYVTADWYCAEGEKGD